MKKSFLDNPSSAEARASRVKFIRSHLLDLTREEFCKDSNIAVQSLKGWELAWGGGLSQMGAEKIAKHVKQLDIYCSTPWLLHGIGTAATHHTQDIETQNHNGEQIAKELLLFREQPGAIDSVIQDDAMMPFLPPGTYVGGILTKQLSKAIGKECIIIDDKNHFYVRVLNDGDKASRYTLTCLNQQPVLGKEIKNIKIKAAAPIIWIRKSHQEA